MQELAGQNSTHTKSMQQLLLERHEGHLVFVFIAGRRNVACFKNMTSCIINDEWYQEHPHSIEDESYRISRSRSKTDSHADS